MTLSVSSHALGFPLKTLADEYAYSKVSMLLLMLKFMLKKLCNSWKQDFHNLVTYWDCLFTPRMELIILQPAVVLVVYSVLAMKHPALSVVVHFEFQPWYELSFLTVLWQVALWPQYAGPVPAQSLVSINNQTFAILWKMKKIINLISSVREGSR